LVALDDNVGQMHTDLAKALGEAADRIAERDPVPSPAAGSLLPSPSAAACPSSFRRASSPRGRAGAIVTLQA
jgi:hypothetical protein